MSVSSPNALPYTAASTFPGMGQVRSSKGSGSSVVENSVL
jgi:hypothetical protein